MMWREALQESPHRLAMRVLRGRDYTNLRIAILQPNGEAFEVYGDTLVPTMRDGRSRVDVTHVCRGHDDWVPAYKQGDLAINGRGFVGLITGHSWYVEHDAKKAVLVWKGFSIASGDEWQSNMPRYAGVMNAAGIAALKKRVGLSL